MKKILLTLAGFVVTLLTLAQAPNLMNYQGVARNAAGNVLPNQPIGMRLSILTGSPTGTAVYSETRNVTTNAFGLFNVVVGSPGAITTTGTIAGINWTAFGAGSGSKFLLVEIDPIGGTSYVNVGSTQLVSVPYALNAGSASPIGPAGGDLSGTYPNPTVARLQGRPVAATAPVNKNLLMWDATLAIPSWVPATAAQAGVVSGTGTLNTVAKWTPDGTTIGNSRIFDDGTFVGIGTTTPGAGLVVSGNGIWNSAIGIQNTGSGMEWRMNVSGTTFGITKIPGSTFTPFQLFSTGGMDFSNSAGTSIARLLDNGDVGIGTTTPVDKFHVVKGNSGMLLGGGANTGSEAKFLGFGTSHISIYNRGNNALTFAETSTLSQTNTLGSELMALTTAGNLGVGTVAPAARVHATATSGISILAENSGTGFALRAASTNATPRALQTAGGVQLTGIGEAANRFLMSDAAGNATWNTLAGGGGVSGAGTLNFIPKWTPDGATIGNSQLFDNGTNIGLGTITPAARLDISNSATARGVLITNSSTSNGSSALLVQNNTLTGGGLEGSGITSFMSPLTGTTYTAVGAIAVKGFSSASSTLGFAGGTGIQGSSASGYGVLGLSDVGTGVLAYGVGTGYGLQTVGRVQINGQGAAAGNVLTSDAAGNATWQANTSQSAGISLSGFTAPIAVPNGTVTPITQWANIINESGGANYNPATGEYTIPVTGIYQLNASIVWPAFAVVDYRIQMFINGGFAYETSENNPGGGNMTQRIAYSRAFNAGDRVSLSLLQFSGSTQNTYGNFPAQSFSIQYLHN